MKFEVDECVCVIPRRHIIAPGDLGVGGHCEVNWNGSEVLGATVIALGGRQDMEKAEKEYLRNMLKGDDMDTEPPPPKKSKRSKKSTNAGKENKGCTQTAHQNRATTRRPLSNIQKVSVLYL